MDRYRVRLRKAAHVFCAGHFITLTDTLCEPVHGHNWHVAVEVDGRPDAHGMVVDFILLRDLVGHLVGRLDHRMLLPTGNRLLAVETTEGPEGQAEVTVRFGTRRWIFPADECVLLPLANTTAEWIAAWLGGEIVTALATAGEPISGGLRVAVDECDGQEGVWEHRPA
jgi:6-pyruvoyltetrahydropterin/6-carboxytetrahydropterin synthase